MDQITTAVAEDGSAEDMDAIAKDKLDRFMPGLVCDKPIKEEVPQSSESKELVKLKKQVDEMKKASQADHFDMKTGPGQKWARAVAADANLKLDYKATAGSSYAMQRKFRQDWAAREWKALEAQQKVLESSTRSETQRGSYLSLSKLIWEEKSKQAGCNYMEWAIKQYKAGELANGDRPFVNRNPKTLMREFWYTSEWADTGTQKQWLLEQSGAVQRAKTAAALPEDPKESKEPPLKKSRKNSGLADETVEGKKVGKKETPASGGKADKDKELRKELDDALKKAKMLKTRADGMISAFYDISAKIASDPAWDFGQTKLKHMDLAKAGVDKIKTLNDFWGLWSLNPNFVTVAKKQYTVDELKKHLNCIDKVDVAVNELEKIIGIVRGMFAASIAV
jgi:hypothetical protein